MKKITDERIILRNLKNVRMTYIVQTIGILCILGYEFFQSGLDAMRENPLWMVFILTSVVSAYLSMIVSVEHEKEIKNPKKSLIVSMVVLTIIVVNVAYLISITPNFSWIDGLLLGAIVFICGFKSLYYVYRLRVKQEQDLEDEYMENGQKAKVEIFLANDVEDDDDPWVCKRTKFYHKGSICFIEKRKEMR